VFLWSFFGDSCAAVGSFVFSFFSPFCPFLCFAFSFSGSFLSLSVRRYFFLQLQCLVGIPFCLHPSADPGLYSFFLCSVRIFFSSSLLAHSLSISGLWPAYAVAARFASVVISQAVSLPDIFWAVLVWFGILSTRRLGCLCFGPGSKCILLSGVLASYVFLGFYALWGRGVDSLVSVCFSYFWCLLSSLFGLGFSV